MEKMVLFNFMNNNTKKFKINNLYKLRCNYVKFDVIINQK